MPQLEIQLPAERRRGGLNVSLLEKHGAGRQNLFHYV